MKNPAASKGAAGFFYKGGTTCGLCYEFRVQEIAHDTYGCYYCALDDYVYEVLHRFRFWVNKKGNHAVPLMLVVLRH